MKLFFFYLLIIFIVIVENILHPPKLTQDEHTAGRSNVGEGVVLSSQNHQFSAIFRATADKFDEFSPLFHALHGDFEPWPTNSANPNEFGDLKFTNVKSSKIMHTTN